MRDVDACREAYPEPLRQGGRLRQLARQADLARSRSSCNRPAEEPGFRLERQDKANRQMRYTLHPYAQREPVGRRYGNEGDLATSRDPRPCRRPRPGAIAGRWRRLVSPRARHDGQAARRRRPGIALFLRGLRWHRGRPPPARSRARRSGRSTSRPRSPTGRPTSRRSSASPHPRGARGARPRPRRARAGQDAASVRSPRCSLIDRLRAPARPRARERPTLHMSFTGSPGTGKTTVALRMADILHRLGYLREGPSGLGHPRRPGRAVRRPHGAEDQGRASSGRSAAMLFIDEAYYLHRPENERDYGQEAIEILLQVMESERDDLVVVMAGYKEPMEAFFAGQPGHGIAGRPPHLLPRLRPRRADADRRADGGRAGVRARARTPRRPSASTSSGALGRPRFAHGRSIRNAIERARMRQATRLFDAGGTLTKRELVTLEPGDITRSSVFSDTEEEAGVA